MYGLFTPQSGISHIGCSLTFAWPYSLAFFFHYFFTYSFCQCGCHCLLHSGARCLSRLCFHGRSVRLGTEWKKKRKTTRTLVMFIRKQCCCQACVRLHGPHQIFTNLSRCRVKTSGAQFIYLFTAIDGVAPKCVTFCLVMPALMSPVTDSSQRGRDFAHVPNAVNVGLESTNSRRKTCGIKEGRVKKKWR